MTALAGKVALVTGASRGIGKGVAIALGETGAQKASLMPLPGTIHETAALVNEAGGKGIALRSHG